MNKKIIYIVGIILIVGIVVFSYFKLNKKETNKLIVEMDKIVLKENSNYTLKAITYPNKEELTYKSLDESIVVIDEIGNFDTLKEGTTKIEVKSKSETKEVEIEVKNEEIEIVGVELLDEEVELRVLEEYLLKIKIYPDNAIINDIIWESSNEEIVEVNEGIIKAKQKGTSQITVRIKQEETEIVDSIMILVGQNDDVKVKELTFTEEIITLGLNETYQLNPIIEPNNASDKSIIYSGYDEEVISINNGVIKGLGKGETKVKATSSNNKEVELEVKVIGKEGLTLNVEEIKIAKGETYQLKSNFVSGIDWYSSNNRIVTVENGLIKGITNGKAVVTVINGYGRMNTVNVIVEGNGRVVNSLEIDKKEVTIQTGRSYQLDVKINPSNATNKEIIYETSDERIAIVNDEGKITGKLEGTCYVTAYSSNNKMATIKVNVSKGSVTLDSLEINPSSITIIKGDTYQLQANFIPSNVSDKSIIWESVDKSIVSVENGLIKGLKTGSTYVTAKSNGIESKVEVIVNKQVIEISSVDIKESDISLEVGQRKTLSISYLPSNATNKSFVWTSSNESIATVSNKGVVTGVKEGKVTITCTSVNGKKDSIQVNITKQSKIEISEVYISLENVNLQKGETKKLRATVLPLNANQSVTWVSGDESIVKVDDTGLLTAVNIGSTTVAVIASNGMITRAKVSVSYPPIYDSGKRLLELSSNTLIVTMTQESNRLFKMIRVWVQDPYNQFHRVLSQDGEGGTLLSELMNNTVATQDLKSSILVGGNASIFANARVYPRGNLLITEGNVLLNNPGGPEGRGDGGNALFYTGIDESGTLRIYCTSKYKSCSGGSASYKAEKELFDTIINDGIRNTIALAYENLYIVNGQRVSDLAWDKRYAIRHGFCQVNRNNFIIFVSSNGDLMGELADLELRMGCKTGINFDGGKSTNVFYKNKGSSSVSMIHSSNRKRPESYYFAEY